MKFKKTAAFVAAFVMAAGIFTGIPTNMETASPFAITAEAATMFSGENEMGLSATFDGANIILTWDEYPEAAGHMVIVAYSTSAIPFSANDSTQAAKLIMPKDTFPSGNGKYSLGIEIASYNIPLKVNNVPCHYIICVGAYNTNGDSIDIIAESDMFIDSFDDIKKTGGSTSGESKTTVQGIGNASKNAPATVTATGGDEKISVKWDAVSGAKSYEILIKELPDGKFKSVKKVNGTSTEITGLTNGKSYSVMISADNCIDYNAAVANNILVGTNDTTANKADTKKTDTKKTDTKKTDTKKTDTKETTASKDKAATLAAPTGFKASKTKNSITLSWGKVDGAEAYKVYMYNEKTKKYEQYKFIAGNKCTIKDLKANTKYQFKVVSYDKQDGKYVKQGTSKAVAVTTKK